MNQVLNPFDRIDPFTDYYKFKTMILPIKDKNSLIEIGKLLEERLKEFN